VRGFATIPLAVLLAAAIGVMGCKLAGFQTSPAGLIIAALTCIVAGQLGLVPSLLTRHASSAAVAQAGLAGTMVHLFLAAAGAAVVFLGKLNVGNGFTYWLLTFYWVTLIVLAIEIARSVRQAHSSAAQAAKP
jgi:hypothetical protein